MSNKVLILMAVVSVFAASNLQAAQINSSWIAGDPNAWGNPDNWDPPIVPDNSAYQTFAVTISTVERTRVEFNHDRTIDQLDTYGDVDLEIGVNSLSLLRPNGLTNHGKLGISGRGVEHRIDGNITNSSGAHIFITQQVEFHGQFNNNGDVFARPGSHLLVYDGSLINSGNFLIYNGLLVAQDYDLENSDSGVIQGCGVIHSDLPIRNQGAIYAYGGSLAVSSEGPLLNTGVLANYPLSSLHIKPATDVNNLGNIEVNAGGGVAFDCKLVNEPDAAIKLLGGTLAAATITQSANATFEGFGGITGDIVIYPNGIIKLTGPTNIVGSVTIEHNAVLEISDGQTLITGHTTNNGDIRVVNGDIIFQGGYSGSGVVQKD